MGGHTPGPWTYEIATMCDAPMCRIYAPRGDYRLCIGAAWHPDRVATPIGEEGVEREANARLMAAAPDLLSSLEGLEGWASAAMEASPKLSRDGDLHLAIMWAKSAIAKARGHAPPVGAG